MQRPPRRRTQFVLTWSHAWAIAVHSVVLAVALLMVYLLGLWMHIGVVLVEDIPTIPNEQGTFVCTVFSISGWSVSTVNSCVINGLEAARTMTFFCLTLSENMRAFTIRSTRRSVFHNPLGNKTLVISATLSMSCVMMICFIPGVDGYFHTDGFAVAWYQWLLCLGAALFTVVVDELYKSCKQQFTSPSQKLT